MPPRKQIHEPEPGVMPGDLVLGTRIAETDDNAQR
jgi:hypothetical protein